MKKDIIPVIFRKFKEGDIIALFPSLPADLNYYHCTSYMHIGQHSSASIDIIGDTKPVTEQEYKPLYDELVNIVEYDNLKVYRKKQNWMDQERINYIKNNWER
jgi:hypothetical protein